jgi:hypothetical protein
MRFDPNEINRQRSLIDERFVLVIRATACPVLRLVDLDGSTVIGYNNR